MKKIMLVCSAGMSTSLLVTKMEQAAEKVGDEVEIFALPMSDGINRLSTVDCVLLGPQVRFNLGKIKEEAAKVLYDCNALTSIHLENLCRMRGADLMTLQKKHDILDLFLLLPACFDPVYTYFSYT